MASGSFGCSSAGGCCWWACGLRVRVVSEVVSVGSVVSVGAVGLVVVVEVAVPDLISWYFCAAMERMVFICA